MKTVEVHLGYYKQGDDMNLHLEQCGHDVSKALLERLTCLKVAVEDLEALHREIFATGRNTEFSMNASGHLIYLTGPDELIDVLVAKGMVHIPDEEFLDDDEEEDDE